MKSAEFYKHDSFLVVLLSLAFGLVVWTGRLPIVERLELMAYDLGVRTTHRAPGAAGQIVLVEIDEASLTAVGRWPWSRGVLASGLEKLTRSNARAVALLVALDEPQTDPGLGSIRRIRERLAKMNPPKAARAPLGQFRGMLEQAERELDADAVLAKAVSGGPRLYLPFFAGSAAKAPEYFQRHGLSRLSGRWEDVGAASAVDAAAFPLEAFGKTAAGLGFLGFHTDADGGVRSVGTVVKFDGAVYPSLPLLLAAAGQGMRARDAEVRWGQGVKIGRVFVSTDRKMRAFPGFYGPRENGEPAFQTYPFQDLLSGKLKPSALKNKIVLIGPTAARAAVRRPTPLVPSEPGASELELVANMTAAFLNEDLYRRTPRTAAFEAALLLLAAAYLLFGLPRMNPKSGALVSLACVCILFGAGQYLLVSQKLWLRTVSPAVLLALGYACLLAKHHFIAARLWIAGEADWDHNNRMLGLAFQAQGQLDLAMDKFRKLHADEASLELMYNLALDFERKRQFSKAAAAYEHILGLQPGFRDAAQRHKRARQADQTLIFGTPSATGETLILDGAAKPTLGRYHLEKELGKGAMGIVYLGRDPKINRPVAIKTLALSEELERGQLAAFRERFFREAETAGRLHHPNIVTIYDAGEERDLAYIAMEYVEGPPLHDFIGPDKLSEFGWILDVGMKTAEALDFAHRHGVVHRDIKPGNILCPDSGRGVKVTDFGIARVISTSKTTTGTILGTPSYMSPEQVLGEKVDGRSDLYSFGVTLFEMVAGQRPFSGDSMAALAYQITHAPVPDIRKLRPDAPAGLVAIIKRLLQKKAGDRYATGDEVKKDLKKCRGGL